MAIPIELQGEGSYEYECRKHDCLYCRAIVVVNRAIIIQQAVQLVLRPDDFSINQRKFIITIADSLIKVDAAWYNVVKPVKKP